MESKRDVPMDEAQSVAAEWKCKLIEASAKEKINVEEAFFEVVRKVPLIFKRVFGAMVEADWLFDCCWGVSCERLKSCFSSSFFSSLFAPSVHRVSILILLIINVRSASTRAGSRTRLAATGASAPSSKLEWRRFFGGAHTFIVQYFSSLFGVRGASSLLAAEAV